jgi:hypothetical protein
VQADVMPGDAGSPDGATPDAGRVGSGLDAGVVYPAPGQMTGPGALPPQVANVTYLGKLTYDNAEIVRDLGFSGVVNGQIVWTFGDTLLDISTTNIPFCSSDSTGLGDVSNPVIVHDKALNGSCPAEWIPYWSTEMNTPYSFGEGGTNVIEYAPNKGLVWFLKNERGNGIPGAGMIVGAGVATVTATAGGGAVATRQSDYMWGSPSGSTEPWWGDVGVTYDPIDQNAYVFGHGPSTASLSNYTYLARVPAAQATDVTKYQYWDQSTKSWTTQRLSNGQNGTINVTSDMAIFPNNAMNQSNAFWSNYYNTWMFVYGAGVGYTDVMVMTAPTLEGPWTTGFTIASTCPNNTCSAIRYAVAPHPEYDLSGKTIFATWTDSNNIYGVRVAWK